MQVILARAIDVYERQRMFDEADAGYRALREDPASWGEYQAEQRAWDATLMDGLQNDPYPVDGLP